MTRTPKFYQVRIRRMDRNMIVIETTAMRAKNRMDDYQDVADVVLTDHTGELIADAEFVLLLEAGLNRSRRGGK
jgi:hypothetical protein